MFAYTECCLVGDIYGLFDYLGVLHALRHEFPHRCDLCRSIASSGETAIHMITVLFVGIQNKRGDWELGSKSCYDEATLLKNIELVSDLPSFAEGMAASCLSNPIDDEYHQVTHSLFHPAMLLHRRFRFSC